VATPLAVLTDSDNGTASLTTELLEEITKYGTPTVAMPAGRMRAHDLPRTELIVFPHPWDA
jgi:hypothetical protein